MVQTAACKYKMLVNLRSKSPVHSDNDKESKKKTYNSMVIWLGCFMFGTFLIITGI